MEKIRSWDLKHLKCGFFLIFFAFDEILWKYKLYSNSDFYSDRLSSERIIPQISATLLLGCANKGGEGESRRSVRRERGSIDHYSLITH